MYDALTGTYLFACPHGREAKVRLSSFRALERLPGAAHPAVYRVLFACAVRCAFVAEPPRARSLSVRHAAPYSGVT